MAVIDPRRLRVGITLPSFVDDPEVPVAVARAAEDAGLDGVFVFDHLFRQGPSARRSALDCFTLLGAVASETVRVSLGPLVARVTLRYPAVLAGALDTLQRVGSGRLIAALGTGDRQNERENEEFGLRRGTVSDRVEALVVALRATSGRGYPVWVGGRAATLREAITAADGWNRWGGTPREAADDIAMIRHLAPCRAVFTWGGLAVLSTTDDDAAEKAERLSAPPGTIVGGPGGVAASLRAYAEVGIEWVIVAPVDSSSTENPALLGEVVEHLRSG